MTKEDIQKLKEEFAEEMYPYYGSNLDVIRSGLRRECLADLDALLEEIMPSKEERNVAAHKFVNNDDMLYEEELFKAGWDGFCNRMKGGEVKDDTLLSVVSCE